MTAPGVRADVLGQLRVGERSAVATPGAGDKGQSTPADGSTSGEGMLPHSSVNATSHYICDALTSIAFNEARTTDLAPPAVCSSDGASAPADRRTAPRAGRRSANHARECDCPKFYGIADHNLERCIHIDDNRVALFHDKEWAGRLNLFVQTNDPTSSVRYHGSSEADALDAFAAAEAELLGHEATR